MSTSKDNSEGRQAQINWGCAEDPDGKLKQMFVDIVQTRRIQLGQSPAMRPVFRKLHGVASGHFISRSWPTYQRICGSASLR